MSDKIIKKLNEIEEHFNGLEKGLHDFNRNVDEIREMRKDIRELNNNLRSNTDRLSELKLETETARKVEEDNIKFMQELIKQLVENGSIRGKQRFEIVKSVLEWGIRISIIVLLIGLGLKEYLPFIG